MLDGSTPGGPPRAWGHKDEEFIADFELVSRRTLVDESEYRLFTYHFLKGADWRQCCAKLGLERGNFFHSVYRIEQKLGRVFRELRPYSLFPIDEYYRGQSRYDANRKEARPAARQPFPIVGGAH
jgi:hypothetical protein